MSLEREPCPEAYIDYSNACYQFGLHSGYDEAGKICELVGARLVDVDGTNKAFIKERVGDAGGNDFWIGSYMHRNKIIKRKGGSNCPMMRGQDNGGGSYSEVNCNSAYPFICQKYGEKISKDPTLKKFIDPNAEEETAVTTEEIIVEATAAEAASGTSPVIPVVVCIVILVVLAIFIRYLCNKRSKKRTEKLKEAPKKIPTISAQENFILRPSRTITGGAVNKAFDFPLTTSVDTTKPRAETPSLDAGKPKHSTGRDTPLHGVQLTPPPSYANSQHRGSYDNHRRSRKRRSIPATTSAMSDSTETSFQESFFSDSAVSRTSEKRRKREDHRRTSHVYRSRSPTRHYHDDHRNESERRHRGKSRQREPKSMNEQYASATPPLPALKSRHNPGKEFRDRQSYFRRSMTLRGGDPRYDVNRMHSRLPESSGPIYFPQMTSAWSREDLRTAADLDVATTQLSVQGQIRMSRPGPIRVNRHIFDHQVDDSSSSERLPRSKSRDSDHIYESLDHIEKPHDSNEENQHLPAVQAVALHGRFLSNKKTEESS